MSRRRFRATPAPVTSGGFAIGVTMTPLGAAQASAALPVAEPTTGNGGAYGRITGPLHGRNSVEGNVEIFTIFMDNTVESDIFEWVIPSDTFGNPSDHAGLTTEIEYVYPGYIIATFTYEYAGNLIVTCFVNGARFTVNIILGA